MLSSRWDPFEFPIVPSFTSSCCFIFFSQSAVSPPPSFPSSSSLSHILGDPHFTIIAVPSALLGPSCMQSRCQPGQGGQRLPHKGNARVLGVKTHTLSLSLSCAVSFSASVVCPFYLHAHALHTHVLLFFHCIHTHSSRGLGWSWGQGELELSVCLSLVFQQEAPGPARHLSGAAAADKEEAINPRKITSTDTLSHRNTAMQPDSFHLQCRQRKKEGRRR